MRRKKELYCVYLVYLLKVATRVTGSNFCMIIMQRRSVQLRAGRGNGQTPQAKRRSVVPCGHTHFSWSSTGGALPCGHTNFSWCSTLLWTVDEQSGTGFPSKRKVDGNVELGSRNLYRTLAIRKLKNVDGEPIKVANGTAFTNTKLA